MADEPKYIRDFKALSRANPSTREDAVAIERELYARGNDRATAVMFGAYVEQSLQGHLLTAMRSNLSSKDCKGLFDEHGPLGTFASKIATAYAFKLIGPICRGDLDLVRLIRNEFAHSRMHFNFETQEVCEVCKHFVLVDQPQSLAPSAYIKAVSQNELVDASDRTHPKTRFIVTCHELTVRLFIAPTYGQPGDFDYPNNEPLP
jgi:hypothetical protein